MGRNELSDAKQRDTPPLPQQRDSWQPLPGEAVQEIKAKLWAGGTKHKPYLVVFVRRRALPSGWGTAAIKLLAAIRRPLQKG